MSGERPLDPFVDALRGAVEDDLVKGPDLAAVVAEAHARDPAAVPATMVADTEGLAEVVPLRHRRRDRGPALRPFVDAMRGELDASLGERGLAEIPPLRGSAGRSRRAAALGWGLGVAAALALLFVVARPVILGGGGDGDGAVEAQRVYDGAATGRAIGPTGPRLETSAPSPATFAGESSGPDDSADTPAAPADDPRADARRGDDELQGEGSTTSRTPKSRREVAPESELEALDRQAQAAWRRGELGEAERLLTALTERGGTTGRAELAFGDLFTLAHQRERPAAQTRYWRSYLRVFPRGRFADDARAGLCRQREATAAATCWRRYLVRHPQGSHRVEAEEALARQAKREATR